MSTKVTYYITVKEDKNIHAIASNLNNLGLAVFPFSLKEVGKEAFDLNHIMCDAVFFETEGIIGLANARVDTLKKIDGIVEVVIVGDKREKEKGEDKKRLISILISTVVYSLVALGVLLGLSRDFSLHLDSMAFVLYLVIPAVTSFLSGVAYIYLPHR